MEASCQVQLVSDATPLAAYSNFCIHSIHTYCFVAQRIHAYAGSRDNTVRLWDVHNASTVQILEGHAYQVSISTVLSSSMSTCS